MSSKCCRLCGDSKPLDEFHRASGTRDGHRGECKSCFRELAKARYDSARAVERTEKWRKANPERYADYRREYQSRPERKRAMRDLYYRRTFGISADEFDELLEEQGGGCAICGKPPDRAGGMHLDHDHETGVIRGILCQPCNHAVGLFQDNPDLLEKAARYLRSAEERRLPERAT